MQVTFLGAEQRTWVAKLLDAEAPSMGLSYSALRRRAGGKPRTTLAERFPTEHKLLLDSGGYAANKKPAERSLGDWDLYGREYAQFALANVERCTWITEFDFLGLGENWTAEQRRGIWREVHEAGKFLPVWHPEQGLGALEATADKYGRIAVVGDILTQPGQTAAPQLMRLARRGIEVHGLALTKMEVAENIPFTTVASSSWLSPQKFGDVIIFDGRALHRYPVRYALQARKRHRMYVEHQGFDGEKWEAGDASTLLEVGIWSWLRWAESVTARHGGVTLTSVGSQQASDLRPVNSEDGVTDDEQAQIIALPVPPSPPKTRTLVDLPLLKFRPDEGGEEGEPSDVLVLADDSVRRCNDCFLAAKGCPAFEENAACKYRIPVRVETKAQRKAVFNGVVEMQSQRVAMMYMGEQLSGGYADPNLSQEMDRLVKMMATQAEIEDEREYFEMTVRARGGKQSGIITRLMGTDVASRTQALPQPLDEVQTDRVIDMALEPPRR